ncbi:MFS transporter [Blastococcus sp. TF02A-26]|uniref:MFS transporter n=1 Tax=Blastococcus sp. TF02A-26 TaxID=2250577 RepID=UPI000DEBEE71|nr:MFS transporter [Blastococcus sp. TF02A-26]RBY80786.1 MFS transporter [Blastococcus sp. TF02A-26]
MADATATPSLVPADTAGDRRPALVLSVVSAAVFLASLDLFVVNVAFPALSRSFDTDAAGLSWVLNGYTIGFAALLAPAGRIADRIGRRRVFLTGLVVFSAASLGCAAAWDIPSLVAFRVGQSAGAAMVTATSLALLLHTFPPARRASAIAVWSAVGGVAAALGPPIGGLLVEASWRWVFLINLPVGLLALVVGLRVLPESRDEAETRRPDALGTALLVTAVGLVAFALVDAPGRGWTSGVVLGALAGATAAGALAVVRAARAPHGLVPVLPLPLFRARTFTLATLSMAAFMAAFAAMLLGNVLWLTGGWGMSATEAGFALVPGPALAALSAVPAGRLGARIGCGPVAAAGTALFALGGLWWVWQIGPDAHYAADFLPGQLLAGIGVGLTLTNLSAAMSSTLPPAALATGSATFGAARQLGATLGVALLLAVTTSEAETSVSAAGADRGWVLLAVLSLVASGSALAVGRAHHPDLRAVAIASSVRPGTGDES